MNRRTPAALVLAVALAGTLATSACSGSTDGTVSVSSGPTAAAAPAASAALPPADFAAALKRPGTTIIDVRTPAEFAQGHLAGAVNLDVESPDFTAKLAALDPSAPYAVYCHSGRRSGIAVTTMTGQGFADAFHLEGGITAWQNAGGEVVTT